MNKILFSLIILFCFSCYNKVEKQDKLIVVYKVINNHYAYSVINNKNDTVLKLDTAKYFVCFDDTVENFIIVAPKDRKGWWAIDFNENFLFQVYNTSAGEPSPDDIAYGRIRIIDENGKIGFADNKGQIVIKPQFERATAYYKDYAIIGEDCKKIPWDTLHDESDCFHYSIVCSKNGYIDREGKIIELGDRTIEELWDKLNFPKE